MLTSIGSTGDCTECAVSFDGGAVVRQPATTGARANIRSCRESCLRAPTRGPVISPAVPVAVQPRRPRSTGAQGFVWMAGAGGHQQGRGSAAGIGGAPGAVPNGAGLGALLLFVVSVSPVSVTVSSCALVAFGRPAANLARNMTVSGCRSLRVPGAPPAASRDRRRGCTCRRRRAVAAFHAAACGLLKNEERCGCQRKAPAGPRR